MFIGLQPQEISQQQAETSKKLTQTSMVLLNKPFHGFSGSYSYPAYKKIGH
jgi:hypothetical protein